MFLKAFITKQLIPELRCWRWLLENQHRSWQSCLAIKTAFLIQVNKHLTLTQHKGNAFKNIAFASYNLMISNLINLILQQVSFPPTMAQIEAQVLTNAQYHVKRTLGILQAYYSHSASLPMYSTGQGTAHSPIL